MLFGIGLVGISQTGLALYEKELDAYADKYKIEAITHRPLNETDCRFMGTHEVECFMAQHKMDASESALGLLQAVVNAAFVFSLLCFIASIFVFLSTAFANNLYTDKKPASPQ
ncbi:MULTISPECIES: hypothetical protein [unclassified Pseudomonas]|uniref:hypothetical protein n=1 Tax=unclassified Pseudomonas TaxID=196821 RepID=UPI001B323161|nr:MULTISPECIES: hypothetical protein [unclassified Pseudomonas]